MNPRPGPRFGIALPQVFSEERLDPDAIARFAEGAERLGYAGLWTQDQVIGSAPVLEAVSLLCYVAARTSTIGLGVSVIVLPHRDPVPLAKSLATLDQLSQGRLEIGVGLGNPGAHASTFGLGGPRARGRLRRFRDGLATMKALWRDGSATLVGTPWPLEDAPMEPKPVQRPHPRLWFGGRHPNALRRAVREADGWMGAGSSTVEEFIAQSACLHEQLDLAGRDPESFRVAKRVYLAVDDDEARAERRLEAWFQSYYGNAELARRVCVWGPMSKVVDRVHAVVAAGAGMVLLNPVFDYPRHQEALAEALKVSE